VFSWSPVSLSERAQIGLVGSFSFRHSLKEKPDGSHIGWITFAVAAVLQGCLLVMCCIWKIRQNKLGIDDFGNPVDPLVYPTVNTDEVNHHQEVTPTTEGPAR
jgi:hypothetical protein